MRKIFFTFLLITFLTSFHIVSAQNSEGYFYKNLDVNIVVNSDSSFVVEEKQLHSYAGRYNKGVRSISLKSINDITDVEVIDGETGNPLVYSSKVLPEYNAASWGMYTFYKKDGNMNIEWYYNLENTERLWIIRYKVYGGVDFYKDHDEISWDVLSNFNTTINQSSLIIDLPENNFRDEEFTSSLYTSDITNNPQKLNSNEYKYGYFSAGPFRPQQVFTVALGWPKGLLHQSDFWKFILMKNGSVVLSVVIIFLTIFFLFIYWLFTEKIKEAKGSIPIVFTPPHDLPPAMAEIIVNEKSTTEAWSATIVDLAVRGYVKIEDEMSIAKKSLLRKGVSIFIGIVALVFFVLGILNMNISFIFIGLAILLFVSSVIFNVKFSAKEYKISRLRGFENDNYLRKYEKSFLGILFEAADNFSTKRIKHAPPVMKKRFYQFMKKLKINLIKEFEVDESSSFVVAFSQKSKFDLVYIFPYILIIIGIPLLFFIENSVPYILSFWTTLWSFFTIFFFIKFKPKFSKEGIVFRNQWLGFKMYLETAEKNRMQNLTPEIFEKYLPYAMVFGVEDKWTRAFDSIIKIEPSWYGQVGVLKISSSVATSSRSFSSSDFSISFSSSFSSVFSSSSENLVVSEGGVSTRSDA